MEANKSYIQCLEVESIKQTGAKRFKREASSSSQNSLHLRASIMEQEVEAGGSKEEATQEKVDILL